ncbi:hypothetical protein ACT009_08410 [Sphingomonas sp. Tas61C01]|uniref:hypothetical protein n=1 Tax=Sphingomonas sp. Tas61C01 TaxID=3458297 RepID=UPI00403EF0BB
MTRHATRTEMERPPISRTPLPLMLLLGCWLVSLYIPLAPARDWHLSVQVAQVHVSFGTAAAPVRNRTFLFEVGQSVIAFGLAR